MISLGALLIFILVLVLLFVLINQIPGIDPQSRTLLRVIIAIIAIVWLLMALGVLSGPIYVRR